MRERAASQPIDAEERLSLATFTATVERWQGALSAFLRGMVGEVEQARDLTQDTFHDAWRATQGGVPPWTPLHADDERRRWLYHVAYCRAISHLRRGKIIQWSPLGRRERWDRWDRWDSMDEGAGDGGWETLPDRAPSFEERVVESDALRASLALLSPDDTATLLLRVAQGFSTAEAAEIVGVSVEALGQRLTRARRRLRAAYLSQNPPGEPAEAIASRGAQALKERKR